MKKTYNKEIDIYEDYLLREPHSIYNFGKLLNLIEPHKCKLKNKKTLCVGADFIKEYLATKFLVSELDCIDIDEKRISEFKEKTKKLNINKINYIHGDVFNYNIKEYDCLLLFQMDYLFSDKQIDLIVKNFLQKQDKYIIVMTPSVLNLSINNNPLLFFFNLFSYLYFIFLIKISNISRSSMYKEYFNTHKRTSSNFINLFKKRKLYLIDKKNHLINNTNYSLYIFKN